MQGLQPWPYGAPNDQLPQRSWWPPKPPPHRPPCRPWPLPEGPHGSKNDLHDPNMKLQSDLKLPQPLLQSRAGWQGAAQGAAVPQPLQPPEPRT